MKLNESKDWLPYIPTDHDVQVSHVADTLACAPFSATHIAEILIKFHTGQFWEFSERYLAKFSNVKKGQGSYIGDVVAAIKTTGMALVQDWPELLYSDSYDNETWEEYYKNIPINIQKKAYPFEVKAFRKLTTSEIDEALKVGPLWTSIKTSSGINHIVAQINKTQYYDSYEIRVKNFQPSEPIQFQYQLLIYPKLMTNTKLVKNGNEYGFFLPSTGESTLIDKALNLGYPLPTIENGTKVDWANLKPDIIIV